MPGVRADTVPVRGETRSGMLTEGLSREPWNGRPPQLQRSRVQGSSALAERLDRPRAREMDRTLAAAARLPAAALGAPVGQRSDAPLGGEHLACRLGSLIPDRP